MPNPDGTPTPEELAKRRMLGVAAPAPADAGAASSAIRGAVTGVRQAAATATPPAAPAAALPGQVNPNQAFNEGSLYSGNHPTYGGLSGASNAADNGSLGVGIGTRDVRPTGVQQQGSVDPTTGLVTGGVVRAAQDEYDPAAFANQAGNISQGKAVLGNPVVGATGNAITGAIDKGTNTFGNGAIQAGQAADVGDKANAQTAAAGLRTAGQVNATTQTRLVNRAPGAQAYAKGAQDNLIGMLSDAAAGRGPSAAQPLFQQSLDKVIGAQMAAAASVHGGSAVGAARNASEAGTQAGLEAASSAAALRAQEQQAAQAQLGQVTQGARAGDTALTQVLGAITGQARGQDVDTAKAFSDAQQGIRDGSIKASDVAATAINGLNATNGDMAKFAMGAGINFGQLVQAAQAGDQDAALRLTAIMAQFNASKYQVTAGKNVQERGQNMEMVSGALGGGINAGGGAAIKAIPGGQAAAGAAKAAAGAAGA